MTVPRTRTQHQQAVEVQLGASAPAPAEHRVEASLVLRPGEEPRVRLSQLARGHGVGWYTQRTLELDLAEAQQVAALLGQATVCAKQLVEAERAHAAEDVEDRTPVDLAQVRASKLTGVRRTTPRASGRAGRPPTPIARRPRPK